MPSKETQSVSRQAASRSSGLLLKVLPTSRSQSSRVSDVNNHSFRIHDAEGVTEQLKGRFYCDILTGLGSVKEFFSVVRDVIL